jgi:hypothetical protein
LAGNPKLEFRNPKQRHFGENDLENDLKKQSQFSKEKIDLILAMVMGYGDFDGPARRKNKASSKPISRLVGLEKAGQQPDISGLRCWWSALSTESGDYSVISHTTAHRAAAVIIMKTIIEPDRTTTSFRKLAAFIFGTFVALYTTAIATTNGSSHSMDCGVTPIFSGVVKVAIMKADITDILVSDGFGSAQMSQINGVYNTQEIEKTCDARVYLSDFVWSAVNRIISRSGQLAQSRDCRRIHNLGHIPRLCSDGVNDPD